MEGMDTHKILVERTEAGEILTEVIAVTGVDQEERSLSPRRYGNRQYGNSRLRSRSRSRSNPRMTMNRDRIRCYKCREYDHFTNECSNVGTSDSEGHESDNAALQVMTTDTKSCDTHDMIRFMEETEYLNLRKVRMKLPHFCLTRKRVDR